MSCPLPPHDVVDISIFFCVSQSIFLSSKAIAATLLANMKKYKVLSCIPHLGALASLHITYFIFSFNRLHIKERAPAYFPFFLRSSLIHLAYPYLFSHLSSLPSPKLKMRIAASLMATMAMVASTVLAKPHKHHDDAYVISKEILDTSNIPYIAHTVRVKIVSETC